eukprot:snap_masked-scaffold_14-processed-gene-11.36-mRNA-1 protein AED:1.00 eAED:1.00 QI:0/0/0/0/1/1/2/0/228
MSNLRKLQVNDFINSDERRKKKKLKKRGLALDQQGNQPIEERNINSAKLQPVILLPAETQTQNSLGMSAPNSLENQVNNKAKEDQLHLEIFAPARSSELEPSSEPPMNLISTPEESETAEEVFTPKRQKSKRKKKKRKHKSKKKKHHHSDERNGDAEFMENERVNKHIDRPNSLYLDKVIASKDRVKSIFQPSGNYLNKMYNEKTKKREKKQKSQVVVEEDLEVDDII